MEVCGKEPCIYSAVQNMINKMKEEVAQRQSIPYGEQIVVAKIYDVTAAILAEACRRNLDVQRKNCEPSKQFKMKDLTMDTFILLNQLKDDEIITEGYKKTIFDALIKLKPEIKKQVEDDRSKGLI